MKIRNTKFEARSVAASKPKVLAMDSESIVLNHPQAALEAATRRQKGFDVSAQPNGLTLIELVVSIAVTSVLMLAIGSAMLVATHAMPDANGPANQIIIASEVAEQLATELQYAVSINSRSATVIEFTVADRDTDEVPETIRYEWSGTPGDPLTRQYNGASVVEVLDSVQEFNLSYDIETIQATYYLRTVQIKIRTGNDQQSAVYAGTNVLNKPEVTP